MGLDAQDALKVDVSPIVEPTLAWIVRLRREQAAESTGSVWRCGTIAPIVGPIVALHPNDTYRNHVGSSSFEQSNPVTTGGGLDHAVAGAPARSDAIHAPSAASLRQAPQTGYVLAGVDPMRTQPTDVVKDRERGYTVLAWTTR